MTWPNYSPTTRKAVDELLKRGGSLSAYRANKSFGSGPTEGSYAYRLEREIERKFKVKHAVAVNSGTAALHCALSSLDLRGADVVTSPYTFSATASAIILAGGNPVFADVDPHSFCITKETVKRVCTRRTRAILPVNLFGGLADIHSLKEIGVPVIEDACQSVGARDSVSGRYAGSLGIAGAFSFNGGKNVPAGECGAMVTDSDSIARSARLLMNHAENFGADYVGLNYRPNELTCCVAYHGLLELEERNQRRRELACSLVDSMWAIDDDGLAVDPPYYWGEESHVWYVFPFKLNGMDRSKFIKRMKRKGITVGAGYINPTLEKYKAFRKYARGPLPVVTELSEKTLCLLYDLTPDKPLAYAETVAKAMRESLE
jgi:perosamine synthetase